MSSNATINRIVTAVRKQWLKGIRGTLLAVAAVGLALWHSSASSSSASVTIPPPAVDEPISATSETIVLAGGCFWGVLCSSMSKA